MTRPQRQRLLSVSARSGRIGCVVIEDGDLKFWQGFETSNKVSAEVLEHVKFWMQTYRPDVFISEHPDAAGSKSGKQIEILQALADFGQDQTILNMVVRRTRPFANAYEEAAQLARHFPVLQEIVPKKPPIWSTEPYRLVFFDALALVRDAAMSNGS